MEFAPARGLILHDTPLERELKQISWGLGDQNP